MAPLALFPKLFSYSLEGLWGTKLVLNLCMQNSSLSLGSVRERFHPCSFLDCPAHRTVCISVSLASSSSAAVGDTQPKAATCSLLSSLAASTQTKLGCFCWCLFYFVGLLLFVWLVGLVWLGFLLANIRISRFEEKLELLKRLKTQVYV